MDSGGQVEVLPIEGPQLERVRDSLSDPSAMPQERVSAVKALAVPVPRYEHEARFLAFMVAYLVDEGFLPDRDWDLRDELFELSGKRPTDVVPRQGAELSRLNPTRVDMDDVLAEFYAGGPSHRRAETLEALTAALETVESALRTLDEGGVLVLWM